VIHHRETGEGEPIVLLHPGPGLDGSVFFPWFERLAGRYRVIAPDLPGNGRSPAPTRGAATLSDLAAAVEELAAALDLASYTLLGHSFGGFVALTHAVERPERVGRLVASCTAASWSVFDGMEDRLAAYDDADVLAAFEAEEQVTSPEELRDVWLGQMPFFLAAPEGPARAPIDAAWRDVAYRLDLNDEDPGEFDLLGRLAGMDMPVLAIAGAQDRATPPQASEAIAAAAPRGEYRLIADAGHFPYAEQPDAYFAVLEDWLSRTA
jgi:pimeloyl-ACP methyl ester carboxylesterase